MDEREVVITVGLSDQNNDFSRSVNLSVAVADQAPLGRISNQMVDAVKAVLVAAGYSDKSVAEYFDGIYFDEL